MERRLAITYAVSATATLCTACVAIATIGGGLFAHAQPSLNGGVKQVETVDDYIVLHSSTTIPANDTLSASLIAVPETIAAPEVEITAATTAAPKPPATRAATAPPETPEPTAAPAPTMGAVEATPKQPKVSPDESHPPTDDGADDGQRSGDHQRSDDGHEDDYEHEDGG